MASKFDAIPKDYRQHGVYAVKFGEKLPVLEVELNELQKNLGEKVAEEVRQTKHSGFLNISNPKGFMSTVSRNFYLTESPLTIDSVNIHGHKIELAKYVDSTTPKSGLIELPILTAPTEGKRSDFYFLEAWFKEIKAGDPIYYYGNVNGGIVENLPFDARINMETTRRVQLQWRIRAVDGVDFSKYPEGFTGLTGTRTATDYNQSIRPQGGNAAPLVNDSTVKQSNTFSDYKQRKGTGGTWNIALEDRGLYIAGDGTAQSKASLQTDDGYVYAIPLLRIDRRNSGKYSAENPNGALASVSTKVVSYTLGSFEIFVQDVTGFKEGDILVVGTGYNNIRIVSIDAGQKKFVVDKKWNGNAIEGYVIKHQYSDRPDNLFSNIIDPSDITDLRHLAPTSANYNKVLTEEFNKYMRGENGNKKMLKTYHGIRKTPIDSNTVFYTSMDGTINPELGTISNTLGESNQLFKEMLPTGAGLANKAGTDDVLSYNMGTAINIGESFTAELWFKPTELSSAYGIYLRSSADKIVLRLLGFIYTDRKLKFQTGLYLDDDTNIYDYLDVDLNLNESYHLRVTYNSGTGTLRYFINGKVVKEYTKPVTEKLALKTVSITSVHLNCGSNVSVADISISNLDKGDVFATLPKDFIMGYAQIKPSFNSQNRIQSDAQTSQTTSDVISPVTSDNKHITKTQSVPGVWTAGDTIKVHALGGGIISGLIDVDTAKARILKDVNNSTMLFVDNVDGLTLNDSLRVFSPELTLLHSVTLKEIDPVTKLITLATPVTVSAGGLLLEYSASSSAPIVTANGLTGSWMNLGTKEATFTISTPPTTNTEAIKIEYAVNYPAGQGALSDVLDSVLSAEVKGQKLVLGNQVVSDDFKGKIPDSTVANPHSFHRVSSADVLVPTSGSWIEEGSSAYNEIAKNNGVAYMHQTIISGERAQVKVSLNLIRMFEDKFGVGIFKGCKTVADKIQLIKDNVYTVTANWYGYGSNGDGNKATLAYWHHTAASYASGTKSHTEATIAKLTLIMSGTGINSIDNNGFIHLNIYAEPSNGTAPSQIFTDYVDVAITLKDKAGYDLLVPENSRRDGGEANILYVRRATNEIELIAPADENSGLITYGLYTPPTETIASSTEVTVLAEGDGFIISDLGTSVGHKQETHHWLHPLYRVRNNPKDVFGEFGFGEVPFSADTKGVNIGKLVTLDATGFKGAYTTQYGLTTIKKPLVGIARFLVLHEGELKLLVYSLYNTKGEMVVGSSEAKALLIPINGRPLVKEQKGTVQATTVVPKPWKTSAGVIQGYLNDKGEVIATYQ